MGVVFRRWVWLECIGMVSGCCFKEVLIFLIPTPLLYSFFCSSISTLFFFVVFSFFFFFFLCNIENVAQRTFKIVQKSRSC